MIYVIFNKWTHERIETENLRKVFPWYVTDIIEATIREGQTYQDYNFYVYQKFIDGKPA